MVTGLHKTASGARQSALRLAAVPPCECLQRSDQLLVLHRALAAAFAPRAAPRLGSGTCAGASVLLCGACWRSEALRVPALVQRPFPCEQAGCGSPDCWPADRTGACVLHRSPRTGTVRPKPGPERPSRLSKHPGMDARAAGTKVDVLWRCSEQVSEGNRSAPSSLAGTPSSVLGNLHPGCGHPQACEGQPEGCTYLSVRARLAWSPQWSQDCSGIASGARQSALRLAAMPPCERLQRSDKLLALHCVRPGPPLACWPLPPQSHLLSPRCRAAGGHVGPLVVRLVARISVVLTTAAMCASVVLMVAATDGRRADIPSSRDWGCTGDCG